MKYIIKSLKTKVYGYCIGCSPNNCVEQCFKDRTK